MRRGSQLVSREKLKNYTTAFYKTRNILNDLLEYEKISVDVDKEVIVIILKEYKKHLECLHTTMKISGDGKVDSHKIAALFTMLIVKHSNVVKATSKTNSNTSFQVIPFIYFAYIYSLVIMEAMYNIDRSEKVVFDTNTSYLKEFVKLIYANRDIITIPVMIPECGKHFNGIFLLSHLYYFIEEVADKKPDVG